MAHVDLSANVDQPRGSVSRARHKRPRRTSTKAADPAIKPPLFQVKDLISKVHQNQERGVEFLCKNGPVPAGRDHSLKQELDSAKYLEYNIKKNPHLFDNRFLNIQAFIDKKQIENRKLKSLKKPYFDLYDEMLNSRKRFKEYMQAHQMDEAALPGASFSKRIQVICK